MPAHSGLTGADLHEPKGVATANEGEVYIADGAGSGAWGEIAQVVTIRKASNTARTSTTTYADDPDLQFAVEANKTYAVKILCNTSVPTAPDFKIKLLGPSGVSIIGAMMYRQSGTDELLTEPPAQMTTGQTIVGNDADAASFVIFDIIVATAGTAGTFSVQWAQNTSSATATTMLANSYIQYRDIT